MWEGTTVAVVKAFIRRLGQRDGITVARDEGTVVDIVRSCGKIRVSEPWDVSKKATR